MQLNQEEVIQAEGDSIKSDNGPKKNLSSSDQANQNLKKSIDKNDFKLKFLFSKPCLS